METSTTYLLIGGGPASVAAAQAIRERDAEGGIVLVGEESHYPYDKPPLSKQYLLKDDFTADDASSKFDNFYPDNRIDLRRGVRAARIDTAARRVTLENGDTVTYEKLLLATGARPRRLDVPGGDLTGIHYLRTVDDAHAIREAIRRGGQAVIVGAGYIGIEVGAACAERGLGVTLIEIASQSWPRFASAEVAGHVRGVFEAQGVSFRFGGEVTGFAGEAGRLTRVITRSGEQIPADLAVVGIGVSLNTDLARGAGLEGDDRQGVLVDRFLQTSDRNIWAAGDIACFEDVVLGRRWHAEHHQNAKWQGQTAGANMAGAREPFDRIAYFWSDFFDRHMILRGDPEGTDNTTIVGDRDRGEFVELAADAAGALRRGIAFSTDEPKLDPISDTLEALIRAGANVNEVTAATFDL